jgi:hypothetical protein
MRDSTMHRVATHHAAGRQTQGFLTHTSIIPLPFLARASSVMQNALLWHVVLCACCAHTQNASQTHCSTPALLTQESRGFCVSASCGHASYTRPSDARLPHAYLHHPSFPPGSSIQSLSCKMWCYGMSFCVPAVHTRQRFSDPLLSAPYPGVERLLPSDARLPQTNLHHPSSLPSSSIQGLACKMWCYGMSFCVPAVHTRKPPLRPTAPHKCSSPRGRRPSASARHAATHHAAGRQTQGFLKQTSITPLPYQDRASRV